MSESSEICDALVDLSHFNDVNLQGLQNAALRVSFIKSPKPLVLLTTAMQSEHKRLKS